MKAVSISLHELMTMLEAMEESGGTTEVTIFEKDGYPAIRDTSEPDNYILFQIDEESGETNDDGESLH